jgi:ferrous iron transport protein B
MKFVLAGQPNSGKSTIFNAVAGYRSATANIPGSSMSYTLSRVLVLGREVSIVDLPGIYSLADSEEGDSEALRFIVDEDYDVIINVIDATRLGRSLELTLQLLELGRPMIVALNLMDEAQSKGIEIDIEALSDDLGVAVVPTVGRRGTGLRKLFRMALRAGLEGSVPVPKSYDREVEAAVERVVAVLSSRRFEFGLPHRFVAIKLLEKESLIEKIVSSAGLDIGGALEATIGGLETAHGWPSDQVVAGSRHAVAHRLEDDVAWMRRPKVGWRERLDRLLLNHWTGGPLMLLILGGFFLLVFELGQYLEAPLVRFFDDASVALAQRYPHTTLVGTVGNGLILGVSGGIAIVFPYLLPFLIGLSILEDTGYLPRMAYILDSFMHRIGLHGKSVLPLILGYGCSVPAILATRILESKRDRKITAILTAFIPCSARTVVIYGLVAAYLGPLWAMAVYLLNIVIVVVLGNLLSRTMKGRSPGLILEIPDLRLPLPGTLSAKTWLSLKEFIVIAWPLLIVSSAILGLLEYFETGAALNAALEPLTVTVLGLPAVVGVTLVFGVLRKELTLVMLVQALGTADVGSVMTTAQLVSLTLFVVFYVPCVATVAAMGREIGWRATAWISGLTVVVATLIGGLSRLLFIA